MNGRIKVYEKEKRFGFITDEATQQDFFFHASALEVVVVAGDKVTFDVEEGRRGFNAVRVKKTRT